MTPSRTGATDLTDDELLLFDFMALHGVARRCLPSTVYGIHINVSYTHSIPDSEIDATLDRLIERGFLRRKTRPSRGRGKYAETVFYGLTASGGAAWETEREPNWDAYCHVRYQSDEGVWTFTVKSPRRDTITRYLEASTTCGLLSDGSRIQEDSVLENETLVPWKTFRTVHNVVLSVSSNLEPPPESADWSRFNRLRSWWTDVPELIGSRQIVEPVRYLPDATDDDIETVSPTTRLSLRGSNVTDRGIEWLGEHSEIESLSLWDTKATDASLPVVGRLENLESLELGGLPITDIGLAALRGLRKLEVLRLHGTLVTDAAASTLSMLTSLRELDLFDTAVGDSLVDAVSTHLSVTRLGLSGTQATDAALGYLSRIQTLRELFASQSVTDVGVAQLRAHEQLEVLDLAGSGVTDRGIRALAGSSALRYLRLCDTGVTDACTTTLASLESLEQLRLNNTGITDVGLESLSALENLKVLWICGTAITDRALPVLLRMRSLRKLETGGQISDQGMATLRRALPSLGHIS